MTTTCNGQKNSTTHLGQYRHLVDRPKAPTIKPPEGNRTGKNGECEEVIRLAEKVAGLEAWRTSTATDLKAILQVIRQAKVLMALSISGGGLSIISLVVFMVTIFERIF